MTQDVMLNMKFNSGAERHRRTCPYRLKRKVDHEESVEVFPA
jgi:hypothetical protein